MGNIPEMKRLNKAMNQTCSQALNKMAGHTQILHMSSLISDTGRPHTMELVFSLGTRDFLYAADTKLVKELHQSRDINLGKPTYLQEDRGPLLGKGQQAELFGCIKKKKTIAPELYTDKIKGMLSLMIESGKQLVELWEHKVEKGGGCAEIKIDNDIRSFTSFSISKAMFGSKNYAVRKKLFPQCKALMKALESPTLLNGLPFLRYHIYGHNVESWQTVTCR